MDNLNLAFKEFREYAKAIGEYEKISINELANKYCEATDSHNEYQRNVYFSALVLRFWYKINKLYTENLSLGIDREDCFGWVTGAIMMACEPDKRVWQKDPKLNAQQVINQTLATRFVAAAYYESNLQKNQGKHMMASLDDPIDSEDGKITLGDTVPDERYMPDTEGNQAVFIIQDYINKNKIVEAIILDNVANKDVFKHEKHIVKGFDAEGNKTRYTQGSSTFWPFKLVKELGTLDDAYIKYFLQTYSVSKAAFDAAFAVIKKANNQKKYKMVDATIADLKLCIENY